MAVPLAVAAPAAAASLAYLNARWQVGYDYTLVSAVVLSAIKLRVLGKRDRVNMFYVLESQAKAKGTANREFLVYEGKSWTYRETYDVVLKYAAWLKMKYTIAPKEIIAMDFMNGPPFVFIWLALWSLGAFPAFINYNLTGNPLLHCIKTSTARLVFVDDEVKSAFSPDVTDLLSSSDFRDGKGPIEVVVFDPSTESEISRYEGLREHDSARSGAVYYSMANLIFTSGTTGLPKPAICSWNKSHQGGDVVRKWSGFRRDDRFYTCMPLYHSSAALLGMMSVLLHGCTLVLGHKFSTRTFWPEVRASKATIIQYVGETCRYLLHAPAQIDSRTGEDLDSKNDVRMAFGNGLRPDVWDKFKQRFGIDTIAEFYGATEGTSASWNKSSNDFSAGAVGRNGVIAKLLMGANVAIVELDWETEQPLRVPDAKNPKRDNLCRKVKPGEPGELLYKVNAADVSERFQGYFGNSNATNSKIMRDVLVRGDAWFRTGDVLRWDNDGLWWFSDRIGDTFRWKGENVSTAEVAEALGRHPTIEEANVYGVELPNHDGRAGCVAIKFHEKAGGVNDQVFSSVAAHAQSNLPKYAVPLFLRMTSEMAMTGNNKQQKHGLRTDGVDLSRVRKSGKGEDRLYWLRNGTYVEFRDTDWEELREGKVRL